MNTAETSILVLFTFGAAVFYVLAAVRGAPGLAQGISRKTPLYSHQCYL